MREFNAKMWNYLKSLPLLVKNFRTGEIAFYVISKEYFDIMEKRGVLPKIRTPKSGVKSVKLEGSR